MTPDELGALITRMIILATHAVLLLIGLAFLVSCMVVYSLD